MVQAPKDSKQSTSCLVGTRGGHSEWGRQQWEQECVVRWDHYGSSAQGDQNKSETLFPRTTGCSEQSPKFTPSPLVRDLEGFVQGCSEGASNPRGPAHPPWDTQLSICLRIQVFRRYPGRLSCPSGWIYDGAGTGHQG